jgi:hypothetical protein
MKSQGLQELIKTIFSNEQTKSQFMTNPDSVLSRFDLTEEEKRAVLSTHARLGLVTDSVQLEESIGPMGFWA